MHFLPAHLFPLNRRCSQSKMTERVTLPSASSSWWINVDRGFCCSKFSKFCCSQITCLIRQPPMWIKENASPCLLEQAKKGKCVKSDHRQERLPECMGWMKKLQQTLLTLPNRHPARLYCVNSPPSRYPHLTISGIVDSIVPRTLTGNWR